MWQMERNTDTISPKVLGEIATIVHIVEGWGIFGTTQGYRGRNMYKWRQEEHNIDARHTVDIL